MNCRKCRKLKLPDECARCRRTDEIRKALQEIENDWSRIFGVGAHTVLCSGGMDRVPQDSGGQGEGKGSA